MSSFPPSISRLRRFSKSLNPHSILGVSLLQRLMQSVRRLLGNPPPGIVSISGHLIINSDKREFESNIEESFGVGRPPCGKVSRFGQSLISRDSSAIRSSPSPA
ncbi:unnamed protein product [Arabidopsis thaliana]|uniref:Uncharacterized protein n=1 Tax=Arabidopsis thaliana TaxID=3702 RepID=A0A5S9XC37_ARATH|nr:unnamed protein product [Arabidopsis thaliana]